MISERKREKFFLSFKVKGGENFSVKSNDDYTKITVVCCKTHTYGNILLVYAEHENKGVFRVYEANFWGDKKSTSSKHTIHLNQMDDFIDWYIQGITFMPNRTIRRVVPKRIVGSTRPVPRNQQIRSRP